MVDLNLRRLRDELASRYAKKTARSSEFYKRAFRSLPGGVNYSIRGFVPHPIYVKRADGKHLWDLDGNRYVDFWMGHYALIMGHRYEPIIREAVEQLGEGAHLGFEHYWEVLLAEQIKKMIDSVDAVRFTNSGTEANMYAVRLARSYTKRRHLVKFEGCWHGGYDSLHKGVTYPYERPSSLGLPDEITSLTEVLPYNDLETVERRLRREDVAAVFIELMPSQGGFVMAERSFARGLEEVCEQTGTLLVVDEVITGFRVSPGGAQKVYSIRPHITTMGKIVGGGIFPAGAIGGIREVMEHLDHTIHQSPSERSFHGGTYSGNPLTTRCGYAMLRALEDGRIIERLNQLGDKARMALYDVSERNGLPVSITGGYSLVGIHFTSREPRTPREAQETGNPQLSEVFHYHLLLNGFLHMAPRLVKLGLSEPHTIDDVNQLADSLESFLRLLRSTSL
ncbi:MAG: aspartate aminotransferase family protein [Aigarchaeota archaeon]|nr:aspartate aminotransferase family protein [Aigarchaeota archaeon]MDW8093272.1 aspartate aminotransferase family protein [Nitrososphaerota archaeon]